ncbi:hypothetical protein BLA60_29865 [Actinophytocola xinjiangensis]|uniref:Uncharacterized protein n=1 Tax=Actinophytocola xinjiangensis TaxID=485602 RepID=A0A7Z0WGP5_9PSEU|nr:hypothetical protein [Actinophytocola xinjiangensis]OLF06768.1 hypothetical protein BLA60_29865 [Actinophytocola xinjiangensis]
MKIVFLVLGFLFLGAAFAYNYATEPEARLAGGVEWRCEPPTETDKNTECYTTGNDDTFLRLDIIEVTTSVLLGLTGVACMVAAAAVGNRRPTAPAAPTAPTQPYPPQQQYPQRPTAPGPH